MESKISLIFLIASLAQIVTKKSVLADHSIEYEEAFNEMLGSGDALVLFGIQPSLKEKSLRHKYCFDKQLYLYNDMIEKFNKKMQGIIVSFQTLVNKIYQEHAEPAQKNLKEIVNIMNGYPKTMLKFLGNYPNEPIERIVISEKTEPTEKMEAAEKMESVRNDIEACFTFFGEAIKKLKHKSPEAANKIENDVKKARDAAAGDSKVIVDKFKECLIPRGDTF